MTNEGASSVSWLTKGGGGQFCSDCCRNYKRELVSVSEMGQDTSRVQSPVLKVSMHF